MLAVHLGGGICLRKQFDPWGLAKGPLNLSHAWNLPLWAEASGGSPAYTEHTLVFAGFSGPGARSGTPDR